MTLRIGVPQKFAARYFRTLVIIVRENPHFASKEVAIEFFRLTNKTISDSYVRKVLHRFGLRS